MIGIDRFGASAPAEVLLQKYGFTVDAFWRNGRPWLVAGAVDLDLAGRAADLVRRADIAMSEQKGSQCHDA
jgi:hypothetical protein